MVGVAYQDVARVVVMSGIHEQSVGGGVLQHRVARRWQEACHGLSTILVHQSSEFSSIRSRHCL